MPLVVFGSAPLQRPASIFPPLLAKYGGEHESYDLRFEIGSIQAIAERVARNDLDMAIVAGPLPTGELHAKSVFAGHQTTPAFKSLFSRLPIAPLRQRQGGRGPRVRAD